MSMLPEYTEGAGRRRKRIRVALKGSLFEHQKQIADGTSRCFMGTAEEIGKDGERLVILLGGGTKKRQQEDIHRAQGLWADYKRRRKKEEH
jgi:putative component of toxin-antitoxin plasmid stabilization module